MTKKIPAPWTLHGKGYMFVYKFKKDLYGKDYYTDTWGSNAPFSGFGTMMLVDYRDSDAGPYGELLFSPGRFRYEGKRFHSVTKIYVSSMVSVLNGRENWGIPKEQADFSFTELKGSRERITVAKDGVVFFDAVIRKRGPRFPITTKVVPLPLVQFLDNKSFITRFFGKGKGRFAKIESMEINNSFFPDISENKPMTSIGVEDFEITFPVAG
ncbi:MAG: acetoacetate decarboxylase family protein [bacterium]|nr:acetoacetate decarboxylase family protein [bacterium]